MSDSYNLDLISALDQKKSQKQLNSDIKQIEKVLNLLQLTGTFSKTTQKELNTYIKQLSAQLSTIKLKVEIDNKSIKSDISKALNNVSFKDIDALNIDGNKSKIKLQKVFADAKSFAEKNPISIGVNIDSKRSKLDNDLTTYLNKNTKINESSVLLKESNKVRDLIGAITDKKSLREATDEFQLYKSTVAAVGYNTESTSDKIKSMFAHVTKLGSIFSVTTLAMNNFTKSLKTLQSIDDILTEISKTSNLTAQELEKLGDISFKSASKYGKTASDYLLGIQEMSRSGFYGEKGSAMAEQSLLAQAAGDMSADIANNYILATNAAYKFNGEAEKLNAVLDGQNSITNRNSVGLEDMAIAMSKVGTVASSYRVSIEDLSAMIGTIEAVTKAEGSEVGNGIKAILINLQNITSSKITDTLDAANASMTEFIDGTEKLRDPISILRDLAETFNQLDEDDALRAEILTNIGGKHQASKLAALLQNMELFDKMLVDYSEGAGSAMEEAMKSANNWSGKLNQLQNSWDSLVNSVVSKDAVLGGLTFGDKMIQGIEGLIDKFGVIPTILTAVNSSMTALNKDYGLTKVWDKETKKIDIEGKLFGIVDISKIKNLKKHYEDAAIAISDWNCELINGKTDLDVFENACVKNSASLKEYLSTCSKDAPASLNGYKSYLQQTGQATEDLRLKTILLNTALTLIGSIAVQAVITGIVQAFDKFNETVVESKEKVDDINSKISDLKSQIEELNNLEYKSEFDNQKISQLERELELQEKILEVEQKRLYQNQVGTKFSDYFDEDSLVSKRETQLDRRNKEGYTYLSLKFKTDKSSIEDIESEIASLQDKLDNGLLSGFEDEADLRINQLIEKRNNLLKEQQTIEDQLVINAGKYLENYRIAQEAVESGLLTGSDLEKAESMVEYWDSLYKDSLGIVTNIQKMNGTYDNTIGLLEEKFSNISRDDLVSLSDDDKRIALSFDPDNIIGFEELQRKIEETKGDIEGLNGTEVQTNLFNQLTSSEEELDKFKASVKSAAEAYTTLLSGDHTSTELLDSIQTINKAVSDMGGSIDWESINSQADSLKVLGDAIENISQEYTQSVLSGAGIDIDSEFGQMLANIVQHLYDAEVAFEGMNSQLDSLQSSYQTLTGILESYNKTGYINLDNLQSLLTADENLIAMLEVENGQLALNQAAYENLVAAQLLEFKTKLNDAAAAEIETLAKQKAEQATNQNADASQNAVKKLDAETQAFNRNTTAAIANAVAKAEESGVSTEEIQSVFDKYTEVWNSAMDNYNLDFDGFMGGGKSAASKAGGEHADAYLEAFQKEYSHLKDMLDRGEISEAQYLSRLRALYTKYFKDRKEYLDEFKKYESEYLNGMLDLHNKALSGISTLLNRKISAANDAKDASISALQEEKEKAAEAYQSQIDSIEREKSAIDDLIKEKNKKIDAINEEIDAIERAAETRKKNINLQQQEYNLQKMLNNRTTAVYKEGEGFVFETDTTGIRDAREKVTEAKEALQIDSLKNEISLIQKEIDLLEEKKDALSEEQERIQKLMDESNKYYDNLIKQQEKMWDSMIKGMEQQKSRWEELAEVKEISEAFSYIQQVFGDLGYTVEDVLNGSDAAFEDFKAQYISLISDVNSNSDFTKGLVYATGIAEENLGSFLDKTKETAEGLNELGEKGSEMDSITESMGKLSDSATTASEGTSAIATSMEELSTNTEGVSDNLTDINDALTDIPETNKLDNLTTSFTDLGKAIQAVADVLGIGEEGAVSTLVTALQEISTLSLDGSGGEEGSGGIITQFQTLKTAIEDVTSAISGGGSSGGQEGDASGSSSESMSSGAGGEGASGLVGAIESFKTATDEALGSGGEEGSGSDGEGSGAIGQFGQLKEAVDDVTAAIGSADSEGGEGSGEGSDTLIGALREQYETASEVLPETKALFEELLEVIMSCVGALNSMVGVMESMSSIGGFGGIGVTPHAKGTVGNAFANGTKYKGLPKDEKNALVSEYGQTEMIVLPNGKTIINDKPTMMDLPKDTVIFNEEQTKKIMDNKVDASGNAYAGGTTDASQGLIPGFLPYQPTELDKKLAEVCLVAVDNMIKANQGIADEVSYENHKLAKEIMHNMVGDVSNNVKNISNITNNNNKNIQQPVVKQEFHITMPNVTNSTAAEELMNDLQSISRKKYQIDW